MARPRKNLYSLPTPLEVLEAREAHVTEMVSELLRMAERVIATNWKPGHWVGIGVKQDTLNALKTANPSWWQDVLYPYLEERLWHAEIDLETGALAFLDRESWLAIPKAANALEEAAA